MRATTIPQAVINHLRIRNSPAPPLTTRLRVSALLNQMDLGGTLLPPAAILVIHTIADPLAGRLQLQPRRPRPNPQWARALDSAVAANYRRAARPHHGRIDSQAKAILFQDEAELLACLALDLMRGEARSRWWWQAILRQYKGSDRMVLAWLFEQNPAKLPAILYLLSQWSVVTEGLALLAPDAATALLSLLFETYHLADFRRAIALPNQLVGHAIDPFVIGNSVQPVHLAMQKGGATASIDAPWHSWLKPIPRQGSLTIEQQALLGMALTLYHRPAVAHSSTFAQAAQHWWHSTMSALTVPEPTAATGQLPQWSITDEADTGSVRDGKVRLSEIMPPQTLSEQPPLHSVHGEPPTLRPENGVTVDGLQPPQADQPTPTTAAHDNVTRMGKRPPVHSADEPSAVALPTNGAASALAVSDTPAVTSALGGLLYLINVMERLQLPACFEADWQLASLVGPWAVLETLGRVLLASTGATYLDDPLWTLLAQLDGRDPATRPGADLVEPGPNQAPAEWLALRPYLDHGSLVSWTEPLVAGLNPPLQQWLALVWPWLSAWVRHQFACADSMAAVALLHELCTVRGRLFVTTSHVDLVLRLDQINLAARLHGLDQDPGWLPLWGRVVKFHFVEN